MCNALDLYQALIRKHITNLKISSEFDIKVHSSQQREIIEGSTNDKPQISVNNSHQR